MAEAPRSRRATLQALILSLLGGAALWRFLTPRAGAGASARGTVSWPEAGVPPEGALVLPQLVDGHIHLDKTLLGLPWVPNQAAGNRVADRIEAVPLAALIG